MTSDARADTGYSHATEYFDSVCTCGKSIAALAYPYALAVAGAPGPGAFAAFADARGLKMCCRNRVLSPLIANTVSADIAAKRVMTVTGALERQVRTEDAPPAETALADPEAALASALL